MKYLYEFLIWDSDISTIINISVTCFYSAYLLCITANISLFAWSPGDMSIAAIIIHIWKINDTFPIIQCVYVWFSHWPLRGFFWIWELPCPCHFLFEIKEVNIENVSKPICVSKRPLRNSGWCCVWYAQRHLSLIYLFREKEEIEGEVLQESVLPLWDMMLLDFDHWHLLFHASRKTRPPFH